jgi:hypothetical protein
MRQQQAFATISSENGRVLVELGLPDCERTICRSFHAICDAERWLEKLVARGLMQSDCKYLLDKPNLPFALPPVGPIRIIDKRLTKRFALPAVFT